jgi:hypothetical protein
MLRQPRSRSRVWSPPSVTLKPANRQQQVRARPLRRIVHQALDLHQNHQVKLLLFPAVPPADKL